MRIRGIALTLCAFLTVGFVATSAGASNDADFAKQWSLAKIGAPEAWAHTTGQGIRVGIVDTGVDLNHEDLQGKVVENTSCVGAAGDPAKCKGSGQDDQGHGTHVAGIIAADWRADDPEPPPGEGDLKGICPDINLYDLRVLDDKGEGDEFNVIAALQFLRYLKARKDYMAFHGANLSLSIRHDVANYACGRTPVCEECERLVGSGIIVVAAAGNDGYQQFLTAKGKSLDTFRSISITDPGNAEGVITVGSTHRLMPHTYGVSYFSSRGPTGDGRAKPDLVAPGEKIDAPAPNGSILTLDGTSMAAPHVSGAAALLIARHRELAGQPARI
jgi:subtilisin family serine protease